MWILDLINELISKKFYGRLILNFENGKIVHGKKEESFQPPKN